jgi:chlorobactene glucosyltransferase
MELLLLYHYAAVTILALIFANFLINCFIFRDTSNYLLPDEIRDKPPLISILVPARNEERNIRRCLRSLLRQDYPNFEILVLNDNSSDNTAGVVQEYAKKNKNVKLVNGKLLPSGWLGKSYACQQLADAASGQKFSIFGGSSNNAE